MAKNSIYSRCGKRLVATPRRLLSYGTSTVFVSRNWSKFDLTGVGADFRQTYLDGGRRYLDERGPGMAVDPDQISRYRFSYHVKADPAEDEKHVAYIYWAVRNEEGKVFNYVGTSMPLGKGKWDKVSVEFSLPPEAVYIYCGIRSFVGCKVYLDTMHLEALAEMDL